MQAGCVLDALSDRELLRATERLAESRRGIEAELVAHIAEVERRGLYRDEGFCSMFGYVTGVLGLSESAAYRRIRAARLAWNHPQVFCHLAAGELTMSTACELASHKDEDDIDELIERARGKSKRDLQTMLADRAPKVPVPATLRPLGAERFAFELTVSAQFCEKLEHARDLLAHRVPSRDVAEVLERALDALIGATVKQRFAQTNAPTEARDRGPNPAREASLGPKETPHDPMRRNAAREASSGPNEVPHDPMRPRSERRARPGQKRSRHIPAAVKREVFARDGGRCRFISEAGRRCGARAFIEFDHATLYCRGGEHSPDVVRLLCRSHNQLGAELALGKHAIDAAISWRRSQFAADRGTRPARTGRPPRPRANARAPAPQARKTGRTGRETQARQGGGEEPA